MLRRGAGFAAHEPARSWQDIAVRAALTMWHRRNALDTWARLDTDDTPRVFKLRSFAELLTAILALAGIERPVNRREEDQILTLKDFTEDENAVQAKVIEKAENDNG